MAYIARDGELGSAQDVEIAEIVVCPGCGVEPGGKSVDPLTSDWRPKVREDWRE